MKVEDALYRAIKSNPMMSGHVAWHAARIPADLVPVPDRPAWRIARAASNNPVDWNSPGAGKEFLEFHRMMIRHYKWFVDTTPNLTTTFAPWTDLPSWLKEHLTPAYIKACRKKIEELVTGRSDDRLGGFLEATGAFNGLGSGVHNIAHGLIAQIEVKEHLGCPELIDAGMDDPATAHHNELFWKLHGWIDNIYAQWQRYNNQPDNQSPMNPTMGEDESDPHDHNAPAAPAHPMPSNTGGAAHPDGHDHEGHDDKKDDGQGHDDKGHDDKKDDGKGHDDQPDGKDKPNKDKPQAPHVPTPGIKSILRARFNPM